MPERIVLPGSVDIRGPGSGWILVFGGVTREGNRRARRAVSRALEEGRAVVWFDGYREVFEDEPTERVQLESDAPSGSVTVVDYSDDERSYWLNRMVDRVPDALVRPLGAPEPGVGAAGRRIEVTRRLRRTMARLVLAFQRIVLRRISQLFRGVVGWRLVKKDVLGLADAAVPPEQIIFGDEFALTQAWHAVRLWPDTEAAMEVKS